MKIFTKEQIAIVENRKLWMIISAVIMLIGVAFMFINGFNFDTDFAGGISLQYDLHTTLDKAELDNVREMVNAIDGITVTSIQKSGDDSSCVIIKAADATPDVISQVYDVLNTTYGAPVAEEAEEKEEADETATPSKIATPDEVEETPSEETPAADGKVPVEILSESRISATISNEIKRSAIIATTIAVILMLVYIAIRFEIRSALAAILCLIHDIFIVFASYAIFGIPVSSNLIAVMLTILGYSINATIVLFDRIRENKRKMGRTDFGIIINMSARQTFMRSVNTTITTLCTIGMIYILGVHSIKEFALPIIVGILAGLYSSVFLSGSFWYTFSKKRQ